MDQTPKASERKMETLDQNELKQKLEGKFKELEPRDELNQDVMKKKRPKIQRVPPYLEVNGFEKYFTPKLISFGLFHHRLHSDTSVGEEYKFMWTAMYLKHTNQRYQDVYDKINSHYSDLKDSFRIDDNTSYDRHNIVSICMLDGCSILHVLDKSDNSADPEQEFKVNVHQLAQVHQDMLLLGNQIPFQVLKIICDDEAKLKQCLQNFLEVHGVTGKRQDDLISNRSTGGQVNRSWLEISLNVLRVIRGMIVNECLKNFLEFHGVTRKPQEVLTSNTSTSGQPDKGIININMPYLMKALRVTRKQLGKWFPNTLKAPHVIEKRQEDLISNTNTGGQSEDVIFQAEEEKDDPVHLLDYLHTEALLVNEIKLNSVISEEVIRRRQWEIIRNERPLHLRNYRIGSIRELKEAGIRVKKHPDDNNPFHPILSYDYDRGDFLLQLPELTVDESTSLILFNLAAYEMCPDFSNDFHISSYLVFLSSFIEQPEDVKELRSAGILINGLSSDKEVVDLFNRMYALLVPETDRYAKIRDQIRNHIMFNRVHIKFLAWMGEAFNTFLRSPWTFIGFLAATLALILTFTQTWFAIHPNK